ncbi:Cation-independent mannose-6-phosphate receptor CI-MPR [Entomortierella chlamydospora]|nr:Cation-independent mannose-6-phosphate receptor CI-MPR [Entomortierella chlamydospora]
MSTSKKQVTAFAIAILALTFSAVVAADEPACSVKHPTTGKFYDLSPLTRKDSEQDWSPDTGDDKSWDFKLNVCHDVLQKELDVKYPDSIASWGKKTKGTSLGYWFEWRTPVACPTERPSSTSGGGVFGVIIGVAFLVYFFGGIAYNRIVHHARGMKQIPNYHVWAEGFDFIKDMAVILLAKCYRPKRSQTYHNLPVDSEINTLIDDDYEDDEV